MTVISGLDTYQNKINEKKYIDAKTSTSSMEKRRRRRRRIDYTLFLNSDDISAMADTRIYRYYISTAKQDI